MCVFFENLGAQNAKFANFHVSSLLSATKNKISAFQKSEIDIQFFQNSKRVFETKLAELYPEETRKKR